MNLEYNFDNIVLLPAEIRSLRKSKRHSVSEDTCDHLQALYRADLVQYALSEEKDAFNQPIKLHTVHISDKGIRFLIWTRRQRMRSVLLPLFISVATTVVLYMLEHLLLPKLLSLFL